MLSDEIEGISGQIDNRQNSIYDNLTEQSTIKAENQKFITMLEQLGIPTNYYTTNLHKGAFMLPKYVEDMLEEEER